MNKTIGRREALGFLGAAVAGASLLPRRGMAAAPLVLGYDGVAAWGALGMVARAKHMFKQAGVDVDFRTFEAGKMTRDAMVSGHVDIGILGSTPFIIGVAKGNMEAIAMAMYAGKTISIFAGKSSGINTVKDLKGRKVASQLGTSTHWVFTNKVLPKFGLTPADLHIINTLGRNMVAALVSGSVDAFVGGEPYVSGAEVDGLGKVIADYSSFDLDPVVLAANIPVVEQRPKEVVQFLRGWLATTKLFETAPGEVAKIIQSTMDAQGFKISDKAATLLVSKLGVNPQYVPQVKPYMEEQSKVLYDQDVISKLPDWSKLINTSLLKEAMVA
jgi:NitT/TauT family transport system substrate-binding protein